MSTKQDKLDLEVIKLHTDIEQSETGVELMKETLTYHQRCNSMYQFRGPVDWDLISPLTEKVSLWRDLAAAGEGRDYLVSITSNGGSIFAGFGVFDLIRDACNEGLNITTEVRGYACSMGSVLAQAGTTRTITPNSWIMLHEAAAYRTELMSVSDLRDQSELLDSLQARLYSLYTERSLLSVEKITEKCNRKDWWLPATEALELGLVDKITGKETVCPIQS
jgi:ATP-dependent Clp protease protease subunit